jgi:hypothetical protein
MDSFAFAIQDHLELQRRNRPLEGDMPLSGYREPRSNRAVALEDTQEWVMPDSPALLEHEPLVAPAEQLWTDTPAFDWGD